MFYAIYMATRPRAYCIKHSVSCYIYYIYTTHDTLAEVDEREGLPISIAKTGKSYRTPLSKLRTLANEISPSLAPIVKNVRMKGWTMPKLYETCGGETM